MTDENVLMVAFLDKRAQTYNSLTDCRFALGSLYAADLEYTGSNRRLLAEIRNYQFMSLEEGIHMQIESEKKVLKKGE